MGSRNCQRDAQIGHHWQQSSVRVLIQRVFFNAISSVGRHVAQVKVQCNAQFHVRTLTLLGHCAGVKTVLSLNDCVVDPRHVVLGAVTRVKNTFT